MFLSIVSPLPPASSHTHIHTTHTHTRRLLRPAPPSSSLSQVVHSRMWGSQFNIEDPANVQRELEAAKTDDRKRFWRASTAIGSTAAAGEDPMRTIYGSLRSSRGSSPPRASTAMGDPPAGPSWSGMEIEKVFDPQSNVNYREKGDACLMPPAEPSYYN